MMEHVKKEIPVANEIWPDPYPGKSMLGVDGENLKSRLPFAIVQNERLYKEIRTIALLYFTKSTLSEKRPVTPAEILKKTQEFAEIVHDPIIRQMLVYSIPPDTLSEFMMWVKFVTGSKMKTSAADLNDLLAKSEDMQKAGASDKEIAKYFKDHPLEKEFDPRLSEVHYKWSWLRRSVVSSFGMDYEFQAIKMGDFVKTLDAIGGAIKTRTNSVQIAKEIVAMIKEENLSGE